MKIVLFSFHQSQSLFNQKNFYARNGLFAPENLHLHTLRSHFSLRTKKVDAAAAAAAAIYCRFHFDRIVCFAFAISHKIHTDTQLLSTAQPSRHRTQYIRMDARDNENSQN